MNDSIRFVYVRSPKRLPITIAYAFDDEGKRIVYNYAKCSPRDTFTKSTGRTVASGRLLTGSRKHPNQIVNYNEIEVDGKVKYKAVAAYFYGMFGGTPKYMAKPIMSDGAALAADAAACCDLGGC